MNKEKEQISWAMEYSSSAGGSSMIVCGPEYVHEATGRCKIQIGLHANGDS